MSLEAIRYNSGKLEILDQLLLPLESKYFPIRDTKDGWDAIRNMQVRGAPAIGVVACLSLAVEIYDKSFSSKDALSTYVQKKMKYLVTARPTAVNILDAERKVEVMLNEMCRNDLYTTEKAKASLMAWFEKLQEEDIATNKAMGKYGSDHVLQFYNNQPVKILTHCNTGSLATAGYGTALGVVRSLQEKNRLLHCYCTETRPYNQGARLTAYELVHDKLPATLVCDSMASALMRDKGISAVFLGADRVAANGDTANKIGTYQLAIVAKYHNVPFYVVAPSTSIDLSIKEGKEIVIEERPHKEMTTIKHVQIAPTDINCWNPAFDVTPAELITGGIVTEFGVFRPEELESSLVKALANKA